MIARCQFFVAAKLATELCEGQVSPRIYKSSRVLTFVFFPSSQ